MSGYIGAQPVPQATQTRQSFTATANQTSFGTLGYQVDYLDVFLNGVKLNSADYVATNGSDIVLGSGCAVNDILEMVAYSAFVVANQTFTGTTTVDTLTVTGNVDGRDVSVDGTKLDGIEASATADQTNAEIKTAVEAGSDIALGGNPTTTTQSAGNNTTRIATTAFTQAAITALVDSSPDAMNTLNELAAAMGDDASFSTTVTNSIATKLPLSGGAMTGAITTNSTFDGRDVAADGVLATNALPKSGGALTGVLTTNSFVGIGLTPSDTFGFGKALDIGSATGAFIYVRDTDATNATGGIGISGTRLYISNKAAGPITFQVNGDATERMRITPTGDVGIGATDPGGSRLYLQDNHTTNVTNAATLIGNTTFTINGNSGEGSDVMRMGPMSYDGASFIDVSNGNGTAAYSLFINPFSGGNVGIGTTNFIDGSRFQLEGAKTATSNLIPRGQLSITDTTAVATGVGGSIGFVGNYSGTSKTTYGSIEGSKTNGTGGHYGGALVLKSRNHGGNNEERIRLDGDGLKFHGDTAAANGLNDYEEGNVSLKMKGGNGDPNTQVNVTGTYVKIGRLVSLRAQNLNLNNTGAVGPMYFEGLPFAANGAYGIGSIGEVNDILSFTNQPFLVCSGSLAYVYQNITQANSSAVNHHIDTAGAINLEVTYETNS